MNSIFSKTKTIISKKQKNNIAKLNKNINDDINNINNIETIKTNKFISNNNNYNICNLSECENNIENEDRGIEHMTLSITEIQKSIPIGASDKPNSELEKTHTEWRWRFFNMEGRNLVEISQKKINNNRIYIDNTGKWIYFELDNNWEQYITESKYFYVNE